MIYLNQVLWKKSNQIKVNNYFFQIVAIFLIPSFLVQPAKAQTSSLLKDDLGLSGSLRLSEWQKDKSFSSERYFTTTGLWLEATPKKIMGVHTYFNGKIQGENVTRNHNTAGDLREAYLETSINQFDLKIGRQITVWGRADKANPTDSWSLKDYTLLATEDDDLRTGLFATQLTYNFNNYRLIGIWQPEWRTPKVPLGNLAKNVNIESTTPEHVNQQFGIKLDHSSSELDWSISYSHAIDRTADLILLKADTNGTYLQFNHQMLQVYGMDMAKTVGSYGLRSEIAYIQTKDKDGNDPLTKNPYLYGVFGVEKSLFTDFSVNAQFIYRHHYFWSNSNDVADSNQRSIATQVETQANQNDKEIFGATLRLNYKMFNETLEEEFVIAGWNKNGLVRPKVTYAINDQLKWLLGAEYYLGDRNRSFGQKKDLSTIFTEFRLLL